jgi:transcriptional regulator with XRE-family HTH domain
MIAGKTLRKLRENAGPTQAAIAEKLGIDPGRVSVIESDRRGPISPELAQRYLSAALDEPHVLIRGDFFLVTPSSTTRISTVIWSENGRTVDDEALICAYPEPVP